MTHALIMFIMGSWERCIPVFIIFTPTLPQGDPMTCSPIEVRGYRHREIYKDTNVEEYKDIDIQMCRNMRIQTRRNDTNEQGCEDMLQRK